MNIRSLLIAVIALSALILPTSSSASNSLTGPQARAQIKSEEPTAIIERCRRLSLKRIRCFVQTAITIRKEVKDAATGEVISVSEEITGYFPMIADVKKHKVEWKIPPYLVEG